jgi:hypothetical protein
MNGNDPDLSPGDLIAVASHDGQHRKTPLSDGDNETSAGPQPGRPRTRRSGHSSSDNDGIKPTSVAIAQLGRPRYACRQSDLTHGSRSRLAEAVVGFDGCDVAPHLRQQRGEVPGAGSEYGDLCTVCRLGCFDQTCRDGRTRTAASVSNGRLDIQVRRHLHLFPDEHVAHHGLHGITDTFVGETLTESGAVDSLL